jgi:hypothetical protein
MYKDTIWYKLRLNLQLNEHRGLFLDESSKKLVNMDMQFSSSTIITKRIAIMFLSFLHNCKR